jgi:bacteriorhodopsin
MVDLHPSSDVQPIVQNPLSLTEKDKTPDKTPNKEYVKFSFTITYILLLTTGTITFIEAIRTKTPFVRHVLNLETCISIIAGYFYGVFLTQIERYEKEGKVIDWADITKTRYIDWGITTPLMLLALCLVLSNNIQVEIHLLPFISILLLNYGMLLFGFLGEQNVLDRFYSDVFGFLLFFSMFGLIYYWYVHPKYSRPNIVLYTFYLVIWSLYGIVYMLNESVKNIFMNVLDLTAKCLVGLGLWVYYTKIIR